MAMDEIPRGPIQREKSNTWDLADNYNSRILRYRESAREEARRTYRMNIEADQISKYIQCLQGTGFWPKNRAKYKSSFVDNRLNRARLDHLALMTDTRPTIDVSTKVEAYEEIGEVINKVIHYEWQRRSWDLSLVTIADIADTYGTGFARIGASKPGISKITPCGPDQCMPIQPGFDIQESTAVMYRTWKAIQWIKQKFPMTTAGIEREAMNIPFSNASVSGDNTFARPQTIDEYTWNGLSPALKRVLGNRAPSQGISDNFFGSIETEEFFVDDMSTNDSRNTVIISDPFIPRAAHNWWYEVKPGERLYPRKRHVVYGGSRCLSDGPSPYWHGLYPFSTLRFNPVFWSFWGLSKYRDLIPINQAMNQIVGGGLDLIARALNPTAVTKEGGVPPAAWKEFFPDWPGYKLRVGPNVGNLSDAIKYMDPPQIPAYVFDMLRNWLAPEFDRMAGALDINGLSKKKQVPGGDTLAQMQDSLNTGTRLEERMLEVFLRDCGTQLVSNVLQFYTAEQRLMFFGGDGLTRMDFNLDLGTMVPEDQRTNPDFWKNFALMVAPGSTHSGAKDREKLVATNLATHHLLPIKEMYRKLGLRDPNKLFAELLEETKALGALGGGKKGGPGPRSK